MMIRQLITIIFQFIFLINFGFAQIPTDNLQLWLDANDVFGVQEGDTVNLWNDLSGNGRNAFQNEQDYCPILLTDSVLNNSKGVVFDGQNDFFIFEDTLLSISSGYSFFIVFKKHSDTKLMDLLGQFKSGDSGRIVWGCNFPVNSNFWSAGGFNANYLLENDYNIITINNNGTSDGYSVFVNSQLASTGTFTNMASINTVLGNRSNTVSPTTFNGLIVELIMYESFLADSSRNVIEGYLKNKYAPPTNLGPNVNVPYGFCDTLLSAYQPWFTSYVWENAITDSVNVASTSGVYHVTVTDVFGYESSDTIIVIYPELLSNYIADTTICLGDTLEMYSSLAKAGYTFLWSDNSTDSLLRITDPGEYYVQITDSLGCFQYSDTITVAVDSFAVQTTLGGDKIACQGENLLLESVNGAESYLWSTTDTVFQTMIDTAGSYWVEVQNSLGCIARDTVEVSISGLAPIVGFEFQNICTNISTVFSDTSGTADASTVVNWNWEFGNGDTSAIQNPTILYDTAGTYNVVLSVTTDSGCVNTTQQTLVIHDKPDANFFLTNSLNCSGQTTSFSDNSFSTDGDINSWSWQFGEGSGNDTSSVASPSYSYGTAGSFSVQLAITTEFGCPDTVMQFISIKQTPMGSFSFVGECVGNPTEFENTSIGNISTSMWDFGDLNGSSQSNPTYTYPTDSTYNVELVVEDVNGCSDTLVQQVIIQPKPTAFFESEDFCANISESLYDSSSVEVGSIVNWDWNITQLGLVSNNQHPEFTFTEADTGSYLVQLLVESNFGCVDSVSENIVVRPTPVPDFSFSPTIGLPPLEVEFVNNTIGADSYEWSFGDGGTSDSISLSYTYQDSNIYTITLITTSAFGCVDSISDQIEVIEPILDVAVTNIYYEKVAGSNYVKITTQIANYGLVEIQNIELELYNSSTGKIIEQWEGSLLPNEQQVYQFNSSIEMPNGEFPDLTCVTASSPNNGLDYNLTNNEFCKSLNKFSLISFYPNPTHGELTVEYILPENGAVQVEIYNDIGKKVEVLNLDNQVKGINRHSFNFDYLSNGIYYINISFADETIRKKIMIQ